jgi:D-alanyl-D-alanine carboxypeptidase
MAKATGALARANPWGFISITRKSFWILLGACIAAGAASRSQATIASSILIDDATGRIIRAYRADSPHPPASLTKMMTLYLTFEALQQGKISLHQRVTVSYRAAAQAPSKLYLQPGQEITVEQLILAAAVRSANDAAAALGELLGDGSEALFAQRMTAKARELGMRQTVFRNASGLPAAGAYTSARDMAILARAIHSRFPKYSEYFSRRYFQWGARTYRNTNRLLHTRGEVDGMKTGYTRASGFNLVATAVYRQQRVILVVLGGRTSSQRYRHAEQLLAAAYRGLPPTRGTIGVASKVDVDDEEGDENEKKTAAAEKPDKPDTEGAEKKKPGGFSLISRAEASTRTGRFNTQNAGLVRYGIQFGSFRHRNQAQNVARKAYYSVPIQYRSGSTRIAVVAIRHGRRTQFAARLLGFNQSAASNTCKALARRGLRCHTLAYSLQSAERETPAMDRGSQYGVQVGVYRRYAVARAKARAAYARMSAAVRAQTAIKVVRVKQRGAVRYVARLDGFRVEASADSACYRLERSGYDCNTVSIEM